MGNGALMTIWQRKVPNEMQGRVLFKLAVSKFAVSFAEYAFPSS